MAVLSTPEIRARLRGDFRTWFDTHDAIQRKFKFETFNESILFVNKVAAEAEKRQHCPDMCINNNAVGVVLSTESAGGVTEKDFELAAAINEIARSIPGYQAARLRTTAAAASTAAASGREGWV